MDKALIDTSIRIKPLIKTQNRRFYPLEKTGKTLLQLSVFSIYDNLVKVL